VTLFDLIDLEALFPKPRYAPVGRRGRIARRWRGPFWRRLYSICLPRGRLWIGCSRIRRCAVCVAGPRPTWSPRSPCSPARLRNSRRRIFRASCTRPWPRKHWPGIWRDMYPGTRPRFRRVSARPNPARRRKRRRPSVRRRVKTAQGLDAAATATEHDAGRIAECVHGWHKM